MIAELFRVLVTLWACLTIGWAPVTCERCGRIYQPDEIASYDGGAVCFGCWGN